MTTPARLLLTLLALAVVGLLALTGALSLVVPREALILWSTESEVETAGFHVFRATSPDGPYEQVTTDLIPSAGDPFSGGSYRFTDREVKLGQTYYYQLEELELTGNFIRLDETITYRPAPAPNWIVVLPLLAGLLLIWLLPDRRPAAAAIDVPPA